MADLSLQLNLEREDIGTIEVELRSAANRPLDLDVSVEGNRIVFGPFSMSTTSALRLIGSLSQAVDWAMEEGAVNG